MASAAVVCVLTVTLSAIVAGEMGPPIVPEGTRIVDGSPAVPGQLPYVADILARNDSGKVAHHSTGSLITRRAVLTHARHIRNYSSYTIRLGSIYHCGSDPNAWTVNSTWVLVHPDFNNQTLYSDAAIIFLPKKAPLTDYIDLVQLPSSHTVASFIGSDAIVSGWGETMPDSCASHILRWGEVVVLPNQICKQVLKVAAITDRSICAGSDNPVAYDYDGGGPLVIRAGGGYMQIGIFGVYPRTGYYNTSRPASYTRVTAILDWITSNAGLDY